MNIARLYNDTIRDYLPRRKNVLQGEVQAKQARLLDATVDDPEYEAELIDAVRDTVVPGDTVVVVGGGWGVSAYFAAKTAECVIVYEGSHRQLQYLCETMAMNDGTENIDVRHGYVGGRGELYARGTAEAERYISVGELPDCDMLVLDAEGGECHIFSQMVEEGMTPPGRIVVESHPQYGCGSPAVRQWLDRFGYTCKSNRHDAGHVFYGALK